MNEFVLTPPSGAGMITVLVTAVMIGVVLATAGATIASLIAKKREWVITAVICVVMIPVSFWVIGLIKSPPSKIVIGTQLTVDIKPYAAVSLAPSDIKSAVVLADINTDPQNKPVARTNGAEVSGYRKGWFRLASGEKACLLSKGGRVVRIDTATQVFLLAPDDVDGFIARLSQFVPVTAPTGP